MNRTFKILTVVVVALFAAGLYLVLGKWPEPFSEGSESAAEPELVIKTTHGDIRVRLYADKAPLTVENFLAYVDSGFYNGTIFHRVIPEFMIQGGGFDETMRQKPPRAPIENEARPGLRNERGTLAMARTSDPHSATSQFFINVRNNFDLDWAPQQPGYAVFGQVVDGMYAVDTIVLAPTGEKLGHQNVPLEPVKILEVTRADAERSATEP